MIKKYINIMIGAFALLSLSGCSNEVAVPDEGEPAPIAFSANLPAPGTESSSTTRAASFTNGDKVAIVAANASLELPVATDWRAGNLYMNHVTGTVGSETWVHGYAEYPIALAANPASPDNKWYWHFEPNKYLSFLAYSPVAGGSDSRVSRPGSGTNLEIGHGDENKFFPDLLYTGTIGNYNKSRVSVLLNFKHALARLAVNVVVTDKDGKELPKGEHPVNQLKISSLAVKTKTDGGVFDLVNSKWTLGSPSTELSAYSLTPNTALPYSNTETSEWYLLPATEGVNTVERISIDFKVKENNTGEEIGGTYALNEFKQIDGFSPVKLEMGKTTVLTIKIVYTGIPDPDPEIILEGQLFEWDYKGKSTVTIE
ncbi:fimbrillin family protein [Limibacterium fermenti]|mgnify:CR=1 FL=1|uniref:fimbrillin family protein n=1 Tax=Limibacterium fermenti TaxID=3229863 RepID=UPI003A694E64